MTQEHTLHLLCCRPRGVENVHNSSKFCLTAGVRIGRAQLLLFVTLFLLLLLLGVLFKSGPVLLNHLNVDLDSGKVDGEDVAEHEASADEEREADSTLVAQVEKANQCVLKPRS